MTVSLKRNVPSKVLVFFLSAAQMSHVPLANCLTKKHKPRHSHLRSVKIFEWSAEDWSGAPPTQRCTCVSIGIKVPALKPWSWCALVHLNKPVNPCLHPNTWNSALCKCSRFVVTKRFLDDRLGVFSWISWPSPEDIVREGSWELTQILKFKLPSCLKPWREGGGVHVKAGS